MIFVTAIFEIGTASDGLGGRFSSLGQAQTSDRNFRDRDGLRRPRRAIFELGPDSDSNFRDRDGLRRPPGRISSLGRAQTIFDGLGGQFSSLGRPRNHQGCKFLIVS